MLFGASDSNSADEIMQITVAFNHFGRGLIQRMPRCRWGFFHVVNNDYTHWNMYAIGGSAHPTIISQGNRYTAPHLVDPKHDAKQVLQLTNLTFKHLCTFTWLRLRACNEYYNKLHLWNWCFGNIWWRWPRGTMRWSRSGRSGHGDRREIWWGMEPSSFHLGTPPKGCHTLGWIWSKQSQGPMFQDSPVSPVHLPAGVVDLVNSKMSYFSSALKILMWL